MKKHLWNLGICAVFVGWPAMAQVGQEMNAIDAACAGDIGPAGCPNAYAGSNTQHEHLIACINRYKNAGGVVSAGCLNTIAGNSGSGQAKLSNQIDTNCAQDGQNLGCPTTLKSGTGLLSCINANYTPSYQFQSATCYSLLNQNNSNRYPASPPPPPPPAPSCGGYPSCAAYCQAKLPGGAVNPVCSSGNTCNCMGWGDESSTSCSPSCL